MRLAVIGDRVHLFTGECALDVTSASRGRFTGDLHALLPSWDAFREWAATADVAARGAMFGVDQLQLPVPAPRQVFGVGANYHGHIAESGGEAPTAPLIFTKFPSCLAGPRATVPLPSKKVDWEVELVVVIGRRAERVPEVKAWDYVAALTVGQDISERAVQLAGPSPQFSMGKSYPAFGPIGPVLVTPDEFVAPDDLELGCSVDDVIMQTARTREMVFSVPELIERISAVVSLLPGDLVFTGTPAGVGMFRKPRIFLRPGNVLTSWVRGIGELRNVMVAGVGYQPKEARQAGS